MSTRRRGDEPAEVETAVFQCAAPLRPAPSALVSTYESQLGAVVEPSVVGVGFGVVVGREQGVLATSKCGACEEARAYVYPGDGALCFWRGFWNRAVQGARLQYRSQQYTGANNIGAKGASALAAVLKKTKIAELKCAAAARVFAFMSMSVEHFGREWIHTHAPVHPPATSPVAAWGSTTSATRPNRSSVTPLAAAASESRSWRPAEAARRRPTPPVTRPHHHMRAVAPRSPPAPALASIDLQPWSPIRTYQNPSN